MAFLASILALASPQAANPPEAAPAVPLCALISEAAARAGGPSRTVSITADIVDEMHHGPFLSWWPHCQDSVGNTGILHISFPEGQEFAELDRLHDSDFRRASLGKRIYCTCIGEISYPNGHPRFVLRRVVRVWASRD
jgi:hypothetical protein